jgi:putative salt-induced outer membrane protein YdiY
MQVLRKSCFVFLSVLFGLSSTLTLFADQITLKNGDRLSGKIVKIDGKTLVLHTEFAGDVTLQSAAITQISTDAPALVALSNGQTVVGTINSSDGKIVVASKKSGPVEISMDRVVAIRSDADERAYERTIHPGLLQGWNGGASVGFSLTRGNSQTENLSLAFNGARATKTDKLSLYTTAVYGTNQLATPSTTANLETGGIRYDHNLKPRLFAFVAADFMADALQDLNLRSVGSVGLGFHAIKSNTTTLDFLAGGNFTDENYTERLIDNSVTPPISFSRKVIHNYGALTLGEELTHKFGKSTVLAQKLYFFPNLTQTGEYRGTFALALVTKISKWLGWQNEFNDIYVTNPPPGARKNDVVLTTGLNIAFTH